jgi:hypothetical protein
MCPLIFFLLEACLLEDVDWELVSKHADAMTKRIATDANDVDAKIELEVRTPPSFLTHTLSRSLSPLGILGPASSKGQELALER